MRLYRKKGTIQLIKLSVIYLSGDPAYIPRHRDARNLIRKLERDEIIEELMKSYLKDNKYYDLIAGRFWFAKSAFLM